MHDEPPKPQDQPTETPAAPSSAASSPSTPGASSPRQSTRKLRLDQFLKLSGLAETGGQAKVRIQWGDVKVNGEVCTQRGRGVRPGDRVEVDGEESIVEAALWDEDIG